MGEIDFDVLVFWLGCIEIKKDVLMQGLIDKFCVMFGLYFWDGVGDVLLGIYWCIVFDIVLVVVLLEDGYVVRGGFLFFVLLFVCMWVGGDVMYIVLLKIGEIIICCLLIRDIVVKQGCSGLLVFVIVEYEYLSGNWFCIWEQ